MNPIPFQARCASCGYDLQQKQLVVRRTWIDGVREEVDVVHRRRQGPERTMGDCGPIIVVGPNEGALTLERTPTALDRRRIVAAQKARRIADCLRMMPPRADGAPPWEFGPEGCDYYGVVTQVEQALVARALALTSGNRSAAARLLRIPKETLRSLLRRFQYGGDRRHHTTAGRKRAAA